jgi:DNA polymerase-3 subunit epsilon
MRQIVLDTETTGLEAEQGHRIIEIGCIELVNRRVTGRRFHKYLNPERDIDEGAEAVHGISRARLEREPTFREIATELISFIEGAELVIHNAAFDVGFLDTELARLEGETRRIADLCRVLDTLALARSLHPGQRNSLDALCRRYGVDNSGRDLHGALLDAQLLADVYLAMTGGQSVLALHDDAVYRRGAAESAAAPRWTRPAERLVVLEPSAEELAAHEAFLDRIAKASGGRVLFRQSCEPGRALLPATLTN